LRLVVARIGRAHGIKGEVTIDVRTDAPVERFAPGTVLHVADRGVDRTPAGRPATLTVETVRDHNGTLLLGFAGVRDRNQAEELRGTVLEADLPEASDEPDAWYDHELVGLAAVDPSGVALGEVVAVEHPGAQDLLVVRRPDGIRRLVPFVAAIVPTVDVAGRTVVIDAPPGLIHDLPDED
jgi:16S rRNA processing protein RimM